MAIDLSEQDCSNVRLAVYHLVNCWEHLGEIEDNHPDTEIRQKAIDVIARDCGEPGQVFRADDHYIRQWFDLEDNLRKNGKSKFGDHAKAVESTRPRCTVKDGEIICPHCGEVADPNIVEDTPVFWKHAEVAEGEQVICTYGASYEADPDGNDARLECGECSKGFNPPEGWEIDWR